MEWFTVRTVGSGQPGQAIQASSSREAARLVAAPAGAILLVRSVGESVRYLVSAAGRLVQQSQYSA